MEPRSLLSNPAGIGTGSPSGQLVGRVLGSYEMTALLGAGGMGEVYRARDQSLRREVAIKVLPEAVARHPDRLARFEREARLLASLSHPNLAVVHGLERAGGLYCLVMELVRGETLAERIVRGPVALGEALPVFRQIANGLEAAHAQTIVHRDLKPANVMITAQGAVKILDFGLAKVVANTDSGITLSPTLGSAPTMAGLVVGTVGYMSPEQARGDSVDRRTDIWAFGCLLFESLTGRPPFPGRTISDTIATILKDEPDWTALDGVAPPRLHLLIRRCLQKNPGGRLHDIADVRIELEDIGREPMPHGVSRHAGDGPRRLLARPAAWRLAAAALVVAVAGVALAVWSPSTAPAPAAPVARLSITLPAGHVIERGPFPPLAISPDGTQVVYAAAVGGGRTRLFLRPLGDLAARAIPATEGASVPFFSPDGQWLAFYADGLLKKISLEGGGPLTICDAPAVLSASWGDRDRIVFATPANGLWLASAHGGEAVQLTHPEAPDTPHRYPQLLSGGNTVLFSVRQGDAWQLALLDVESRNWRLVADGRAVGDGAQYVPSGHVVYAQSGGLVGLPFDPHRGSLEQTAVPLLERVDTPRFGGAAFAVAPGAGSLVYVAMMGAASERPLVRVDAEGRTTPLVDGRAGYESIDLGPDGRMLAAAVASDAGSDIWIIDVDRRTRIRFTTDGTAAFPVWSADGSKLAFQFTAPGPSSLFWKPIDGGDSQPFVTGDLAASSTLGAGVLPGSLPTLSGAGPQFPSSWASDGTLAFTERNPSGDHDIWTVVPGGVPAPFLLTPFDERSPRFSPTGEWLAYVSDEGGRDDVYVQPFPGPGVKWLVSRDGGTDPKWSRDGRELFYRVANQIVSVPVTTGGGFSVGPPRRRFDAALDGGGSRAFDVSPQGTWMAVAAGEGRAPAGELHVVLNWFAELAARAPAAAEGR